MMDMIGQPLDTVSHSLAPCTATKHHIQLFTKSTETNNADNAHSSTEQFAYDLRCNSRLSSDNS